MKTFGLMCLLFLSGIYFQGDSDKNIYAASNAQSKMSNKQIWIIDYGMYRVCGNSDIVFQYYYGDWKSSLNGIYLNDDAASQERLVKNYSFGDAFIDKIDINDAKAFVDIIDISYPSKSYYQNLSAKFQIIDASLDDFQCLSELEKTTMLFDENIMAKYV
jgi:hypothetical protein